MKSQKKVNRRQALAVSGIALAATGLPLSGCYGSFSATRNLWAWNGEFGSKWVNWLVFLGLNILPGYFLFGLADVLVLNSLEFWTGDNPVKVSKSGHTVRRQATADPNTLAISVEKDGERTLQVYVRKLGDEHVQLLDSDHKLMSEVVASSDGGCVLRGRDSQALVSLNARERNTLAAQLGEGRELRASLNTAMGPRRFQLAQAQGLARTHQL